MSDLELQLLADLVFDKLKSKFHGLDGVVGARGRRGEDGRQGEQGKPGKDAKDGEKGDTGTSTRLVIVYKVTSTENAPTSPSGGSWDFMTNTVTPPSDWTVEAPNDPTGYVWQSQAIFDSKGTMLLAWTQPFRISAKDGKAGEDALNIEYIYHRTEDQTKQPSVPDNHTNEDDYVPHDWKDNPEGITEELKAEWVCSRLRQENGTWGNWIGPTLWSVWGSAGKDGDGVLYVYKLTEDKTPPKAITQVDNENVNEFIPEGWRDDPLGVTEDMPFEWVSSRKFNGKELQWGEWSEPKLWASWGLKGDTGLSAKFMYQDCLKGVKAPVIENRKDPNPGAQWKPLVPFPIEEGHVVWACLALIDGEGKVWCDESQDEKKQGWQGPWIITGADGDKGETGNEPDYVAIVFKQSELKPEKPKGTDPNSPGDSWSPTAPVETNNGNWWGCWGNVKHVDNPAYEEAKLKKKAGTAEPLGLEEEEDPEVPRLLKTVTWGDPLPLNGNLGNPCVLASFLITNISKSGSKSGNVSDTNGCINQGIRLVSYSMSGGLLTVTITPKAGYTVKATSANCNIGTTNWITVKQLDKRQRSGGAMLAAHILIESSSSLPKIYCLAWSLGNKNNDTAELRSWGEWLTSFTMTIFGTVTRNNVAASV